MTTADGCAVEVYILLPELGEAEIVHAVAPPGTAVLDLGTGTGRIAHRLIELGHPVTAVDDSAEMLAHVRGAETVLGRIEELRLDRRFDAVLLASHLINMPDNRAVLEAVRRHLTDDGRAVIEWHPPEWFDTLADGMGGYLGEVSVELLGVSRRGDLLSATVRYQARGAMWDQPFTARRLTEEQLERSLRQAGLTFATWCSPDRHWFTARKMA